jgi:membrane protein DedA with SNARE-associated domain
MSTSVALSIGMRNALFQVANVSSAILWAFVMLLPGAFLFDALK